MELKTEVLDRKPMGMAVPLVSLLIDEYVLCVRMRDARRNVNGRNITELRMLFGDQCKYLDGIVLDMLRKARALGNLAPVTFAHCMETTRLKRHNEKLTGQNQIMEALLDDHESIIRRLSEECFSPIGETIDGGLAGFMSALLGQHLEMAGALKERLQDNAPENHEGIDA
jgi:starvation-inducible DNA-binding protein